MSRYESFISDMEYAQHRLYKGYTLNDTVEYWDLSERELLYYDACVFLVDSRKSLRKTCKEFSIPKSSLRDFINKKLGGISIELKDCVVRQLRKNIQINRERGI